MRITVAIAIKEVFGQYYSQTSALQGRISLSSLLVVKVLGELRMAIRRYVYVEYGPMELDLNLRVRIDELQKSLATQVNFRCQAV